MKPARKPSPAPETILAEYQKTALYRIGIPFEQAIKSPSVQMVLGVKIKYDDDVWTLACAGGTQRLNSTGPHHP